MSNQMLGPRASADHSYALRDINVTAGLDEEKTRDLLADLLKDRDNEVFGRCVPHYFAALTNYCASTYQTLTFPKDISLDDVYVPLRVKS